MPSDVQSEKNFSQRPAFQEWPMKRSTWSVSVLFAKTCSPAPCTSAGYFGLAAQKKDLSVVTVTRLTCFDMFQHIAVWWHNTQTPLGMRQCRHGISLEILFGKYSGNLFEIHFGSLSGILPDTCSAILSGIGTLSLATNPAPYLTYIAPFHLTIYSGKISDILSGIYPSVLSGILSDIYPGIPSHILSDIGAILFGILSGIFRALCLAPCLTHIVPLHTFWQKFGHYIWHIS